MRDDLGAAVPLTAPARRVVSLVPSITEAIAASAPGTLVGATDYCTHPGGLDVARLRGTKNPDVTSIIALTPDLVVANQEENRALDVARLREAGLPVWVTKIDSVEEALKSLGRLLGSGLHVCPAWLDEARAAWQPPPRLPRGRVAVPIWRDPWLWVGTGTYADDVLRRLGLANAVTEPRYPRLEPADVHNADIVLLPSEPYAFTLADAAALSQERATEIDGRDLFWYGPAMVTARSRLEKAIT